LVIVLLFRPTGIFKGKTLWENMKMWLQHIQLYYY
jgi:hypothetical protein